LVSPRLAISSASRSGIIWAVGSKSRGTFSFGHSIIMSEAGSGPPEQQVRPHFCPSYTFAHQCGKNQTTMTVRLAGRVPHNAHSYGKLILSPIGFICLRLLIKNGALSALHPRCGSAWCPDADRHDSGLILLGL
jgi:hypothetical protein